MLRKSCGVMRFAYNWALNKQIENYKNGGKFIQDGVLRKEFTILRNSEEYQWLKEISNDIPKQAIKDCCQSFKRFFKGISKFPRFKTKKSTLSFYNDNVKLKINENKVLISKIGYIKLSEIIPSCKYYNPRISFDGKYWYISVGIDVEYEEPELTNEVIGIDLGIKELAVCSNGMKFKNINKIDKVKRIARQLKKKQKAISKIYEKRRSCKSRNTLRLEEKIRHLHRKLKNIRANHIHQVTTKLVKTKPAKIVMETLNIKGMMKNRHLSKSIQEQCFNKFINIMTYKCNKYGIELKFADRFYPSSKLCSNCGHKKVDLKLSDRVYICSECGLKIDRDFNASLNLAKL